MMLMLQKNMRTDASNAQSDAEIADLAKTAVYSGIHAAQRIVAWVLFHLQQDPDILHKLRSEIQNGASHDLGSLNVFHGLWQKTSLVDAVL